MADRISPQYQFEPYVFLEERGVRDFNLSGAIRFVNIVRDVVIGAETLVQLLDWDDSLKTNVLDSDSPSDEPQPVLNEYHRGALMRYLAQSLRLLNLETERHAGYLAKAAKEVAHG